MSKAKDIVKTAINPFWSASEKGGKKASEEVAKVMTPDMPELNENVAENEVVMPDADEATLMKNRKAAVARQRQRSGRRSTILSSSDKLGG
ncbi:hypothetical protein [Marinobacter salarius]|uniref:Uncharacterized protein n=1 Tax=Marinobacter salarius TaxID=1420917 RepID=A0A1W6K969_9GAMM|nr:hypothetical protein [Marinobacter salarius]ARM83985.1 hypothetical protein MARSALSMR5_01907 [Marinobacter salarius]